jgi:hypothetical protein
LIADNAASAMTLSDLRMEKVVPRTPREPKGAPS